MLETASSPDIARPLCQTLAEASLARIYAPSHANDAAYGLNLAWFSSHKNPKRRCFIRIAIGPEFEPCFIGPQPLSLWTLVLELSPGLHIVLPVWRGPPFFRVCDFKYVSVANVSSDSEISNIASECFRRGGLDEEAMSSWKSQTLGSPERSFASNEQSWGR
jgi:hypothetical protein